ncbi:hypothetical protein QJS10_CPA06g01338 [Acorus calamus]|uniref:F-box domain-containing protein n=1 Tax=Acorus calamus TaxID=4465 RepID=A0AAV9ELA8_ACOCL|nr:hypothetical protein QJS10_CPA06g01338 [Acorus calamus]
MTLNYYPSPIFPADCPYVGDFDRSVWLGERSSFDEWSGKFCLSDWWADDDKWYGYWDGWTCDGPDVLWRHPMDDLGRLPPDPFDMDLASSSSSASSTVDDLDCEIANVDDFEPESPVLEAEVWDSRVEGGEPHEALLFALGYLGLRDLLSAERVCKTWQTHIQNDPLLWRNIHIEEPLNVIKDDELFRLVRRAQGYLESLTMINCRVINEECLRRVLEISPKLKRLSIPGCLKIMIEGLIDMLKCLNLQGLKHLRVYRLHNVQLKHYQELKLLLDADKSDHQKTFIPIFFHNENSSYSFKNVRKLDIEPCYMCGKPWLLFDCPLESCKGSQSSSSPCRACINCIPRCMNCGRCINNIDYVETFCLSFCCWGCKEVLEAYGMEVK